MRVFDDRLCTLGEGALWHPERGQLFWFDIPEGRILWQGGSAQFDGPISAAGWVDRDHLLVASYRGLHRFGIETQDFSDVVALEEHIASTRSNDGRADLKGGFWIGTMSRTGEAGAGALYRYAQGELRQLRSGLTTPNAICFSPDGRMGYHSDTRQRKVFRWALDDAGWPVGAPEAFIDLSEEGLRPDGAVTDANGDLWIAQWAAARVAHHDSTGKFVRAYDVPAPNSTCPAFGGANLRDLYVTSAREKMNDADLAQWPQAGAVFVMPNAGQGRPEPRVIL